MSGYLIDTNVVAALLRRPPDAEIAKWIGSQVETDLFLSVITVGEIRKGISMLAPQVRRRADAIEAWLERDLLVRFAGRILPIDLKVAAAWGRILGESHRRGASRPAVDALIGATASVHALAVVTRNVRDFAGMGIAIANPWGE
ncbi:MAG: type II toxin-antitoxin system VapC family toxin [Alphaproteobacteria bacterium]|nr:type II toxin-antitoxin system VapC family toxin [Alphaproteobacteria bacterium]